MRVPNFDKDFFEKLILSEKLPAIDNFILSLAINNEKLAYKLNAKTLQQACDDLKKFFVKFYSHYSRDIDKLLIDFKAI